MGVHAGGSRRALLVAVSPQVSANHDGGQSRTCAAGLSQSGTPSALEHAFEARVDSQRAHETLEMLGFQVRVRSLAKCLFYSCCEPHVSQGVAADHNSLYPPRLTKIPWGKKR